VTAGGVTLLDTTSGLALIEAILITISDTALVRTCSVASDDQRMLGCPVIYIYAIPHHSTITSTYL